ncbi:MAG: FtsX-like permease family protein [Clostridiaceae bacterium]|jgi:putative ABC transport system permease protein|nr:FtsX-like permease family protein [Clostridiaceae bacterium]
MLFRIAWRDLQQKPLQHTLAVTVATAAIGLSLVVILMAASVQQGMINASMPFDMIVGAKGSPTQLIFNTIFLQDTPIGNIPASIHERLLNDERAKKVIPFAFGDNYSGYRIVGTTEDIFQLRPSLKDEPIFVLKEGRFFTEEHEVVLGADVAGKLRLKIGDTFKASHGIVKALEHDEHDEAYAVVGILKKMNMPYDSGIFTSIESVWEIHGNKSHDVTALMVTPKDYTGLMQMYQEINSGNEAQAAFPGAVMADIFDMLGQSEDIMAVVSYIVLVMALLTIVLSLYWSVLNRTRENAILRAIGAGRQDILKIVVIESTIIILISIIFGFIFGHLLAYAAAAYLQSTTALYAPVSFVTRELRIAVSVALMGIAASLLPALNAYKTDVAKNLLPK